MHTDTLFPLCNREVRIRRTIYPSTAGGGLYYTPCLWQDGTFRGTTGTQYALWRARVQNRMNTPSPLTVTTWGSYNTITDSGVIYAKFHNDSSITVRGKVFWCITEDSVYYVGPNGDPWHNHVARKYLPGPYGETTPAVLAPHDSTIRFQGFKIQSGWNENRCWIVTWLQDTVVTVLPGGDSIKQVWQSGMRKVTTLLSVEDGASGAAPTPRLRLSPNPCGSRANFTFVLPAGVDYRIVLFDAVGRRVRILGGQSAGGNQSIAWDLKDAAGTRVRPGVYLYRFDARGLKQNGDIIVN